MIFAIDGVNLFGGEILNAINATDDDNVSAKSSIRTVTQQELIALGTAFPACVLAILTLKRTGTKLLQVIGFLFIAACFLLLAVLFAPLSHGAMANTDALFAMYCLLLFSLSYGPNLTTFILPAETYPKEVRATFNGISAASGKLGAFAGVYMFGPIAEGSSYPTGMHIFNDQKFPLCHPRYSSYFFSVFLFLFLFFLLVQFSVMIICAVLSLIGAAISQFFITVKRPLIATGNDDENAATSDYNFVSEITQRSPDKTERENDEQINPLQEDRYNAQA